MKNNFLNLTGSLLLYMAANPVFAGVTDDWGFLEEGDEIHREGAVIRGGRDEYFFNAESGVYLSVSISAQEDNAVFRIYGEVEGTWTPLIGADEGDDAREWEDELPGGGSGRFKIVVGPTRGNATYELEAEFE
jgi:hypothetical protein